MTTSGCSIRPAVKQDARRIAELYSVSSGGVANYVWTALSQPGEAMLDVGERRYEREGVAFSYQSCRVVEAGDAVVGMMAAFPMQVDPDYVESDPVLVPYSALEEDNSYYICGVALDEGYRGLGIGSRLMRGAEERCVELGFDRLSLIVFEQNRAAKRLYDRLGYFERARHAVVPHPLIRYTGDALLMVKLL